MFSTVACMNLNIINVKLTRESAEHTAFVFALDE